MKISKNGKISILIYQESYPLTWIPIIPHIHIRKGKKGLKILNWTKGRVEAHLKSFDNKHTPKISSHYDTLIQNDGR